MTRNYKVRQGGLLRCCLLSLDDMMHSMDVNGLSPVEGDRVGCRYCQSSIQFHQGSWQWVGLSTHAPAPALGSARDAD